MKNILKNKILIILIIFAVLLGFGSNVFANFDFTYNDTNYSFPDLPLSPGDGFDYIICIVNGYRMCIYNDHLKDCYISDTSISQLSFSKTVSLNSYAYTLNNGQWELSQTFENESFSQSQSYYKGVVFSSIPLEDSSGNVVFQGAPQVQEATMVLAPIVEQAETEKVTAEIVGLLPLIVVLLVSLIAIYKAIRFLRNVLKAS